MGIDLRVTQGTNLLMLPFFFQMFQLVVGHPMDTVHRTGIDRLLDNRFIVPILAKGPGAAMLLLNGESIGSHVGTVLQPMQVTSST